MPSLRALIPAAVVSFAAACSTIPSPPPPAPPRAPAPVAQLAGTWVLTTESPMGSRDSDAIFSQQGRQLSGKIVSPGGEVPITGNIDGDAVAFGISISVQGRELKIDYTGTVEGDRMSGTVQFGSFGDGKWSGRRKVR